MMILFLVLIGFVVWYVLKSRGIDPVGKQPSAIDILRRRYASGEITREEFLALRKDLGI